MRVWERILYALGLIKVEAEPEQEDNFEEPQTVKRGKVVKFHGSDQNSKLILSKPTGFSEVEVIAGHIKGGRTVVLDLENLDSTDARRTVDFLSGVIFTLNGTSHKINNHTFIFAPAGVSLNSDLKFRMIKSDDRMMDIDTYFKNITND